VHSQFGDYSLKDSVNSIRAGISNKILDDYNREFRVPVSVQEVKLNSSVCNSIKVLEYAKPASNGVFPISPSKLDKPMKIYKGSLEGFITLSKSPNPIQDASRFRLLHSLMKLNHNGSKPTSNDTLA
jgi:hypothetical protein